MTAVSCCCLSLSIQILVVVVASNMIHVSLHLPVTICHPSLGGSDSATF
jgi:hypothetical protein